MAWIKSRTTANEEQLSRLDTASRIAKMDDAQSTRLALAVVSPNVKLAALTPMFGKKTIVGSPLKRSFTEAIEEGGGLLYLKRRRLAEGEVLSDMAETVSHPRKEPLLNMPLNNSSVRNHCVVAVAANIANAPEKADLPSIVEPSQSPTEPNTPSEDGSTQGSSAERKSFSSLINYDPSSQTSNSASNVLSSGEMLRLRLRIAMYKVRTNQVESSFDNLKDEDECRELAHRQAVDDAVAELRREAQDILARASCGPSSSSATSGGVLLHPRWPRSLPASVSPEKLLLPREAGTPLRALLENNTPPNTGSRLSRLLEPELTSSVVKGRVAEGLLGLRNAV